MSIPMMCQRSTASELETHLRTPHVLLVPALWVGHFKPFLQICHQLVTHNIGFTILTTPKRCDDLEVHKANGQFRNVDIEFLPFFREDSILTAMKQLPEEDLQSQFVAQLDQLVTSKFTCLIADMFLGFTEPYAKEWGIPWYSMISTNTSGALLLLHGQAAVDGGWQPLNPVKKNQSVELPGLEMYKAGELPLGLSDNPHTYCFHSKALKRATGLLINSFEELEKQQLKVLRSQLQVMAIDGKVPKVLSIGPMLLLEGLPPLKEKMDTSLDNNQSIQWLDTRPKSSVLFVAFGSYDSMPLSVAREIERGLKSSLISFLWALRLPSNVSLKDILSADFASQTKDRGLVVTEWVPQQEILKHPSTGGFLSHCGWNSIQEAFFATVPIVACPLWAEQAMNARFVVEVLEVAVEVRHNGTVGEFDGEEVARAVQTILSSERNDEIRKKLLKLKSAGIQAVAEGGSSHRHLEEFLADISQMNHRR